MPEPLKAEHGLIVGLDAPHCERSLAKSESIAPLPKRNVGRILH